MKGWVTRKTFDALLERVEKLEPERPARYELVSSVSSKKEPVPVWHPRQCPTKHPTEHDLDAWRRWNATPYAGYLPRAAFPRQCRLTEAHKGPHRFIKQIEATTQEVEWRDEK